MNITVRKYLCIMATARPFHLNVDELSKCVKTLVKLVKTLDVSLMFLPKALAVISHWALILKIVKCYSKPFFWKVSSLHMVWSGRQVSANQPSTFVNLLLSSWVNLSFIKFCYHRLVLPGFTHIVVFLLKNLMEIFKILKISLLYTRDLKAEKWSKIIS